MIIAIDFDGTCVTHEYPNIGKEIGAVPVLKAIVDNGHKLILHTMRSGKTLSEAQKWFSDNGIELYGINENPTQKNWTQSSKAFANLYIDDAGLGIPLIRSIDRPYVDWRQVAIALADKGCLFKEDVVRAMPIIMQAQEDLELYK
jgi:hypothetical protein